MLEFDTTVEHDMGFRICTHDVLFFTSAHISCGWWCMLPTVNDQVNDIENHCQVETPIQIVVLRRIVNKM